MHYIVETQDGVKRFLQGGACPENGIEVAADEWERQLAEARSAAMEPDQPMMAKARSASSDAA